MPGPIKEEWIVAVRCGRCHHLIRALDPGPDGTFEISNLPSVCPARECMAGFGTDTSHTLVVAVYRRGRGD